MFDAAVLGTIGFAATMGVATFFSPCAYPLLPGYVGFYVSQTDGDASLGGAISRGIAASVGILATFAVLTAVAFSIGHAAFSRVTILEPVVGALLVVFGVLVVVDRAPSLSMTLPKRRSSVLGFGIFGTGYALAAAGCVAPLFVGVVGRAVTLSTSGAVLVMATYAGIVAALMLAVTVATGMGLVAGAGRLSAYIGTLERVAGGVMIVAGLAQIYLGVVGTLPV
ncbi:cytochrome c biogenesis CcdA family protein [Natrialbaceae archaeon AArc-T1-2]|uniref:cytochrome c biogenesis CcdA family protein n=1 Tax=Natrialbaceae archaeon AArc-T1-2 TaxID=3053904 RepID=UPI00255B2029|nr:cytochrome c biogenesis protein CcdA [Natrialbaceae archaeon AArc-T1-2]WIV67070.1 cytochrome c biogenesis protein CcdA [Natrialbaceae archaeon AArc-T1-2]